MNKYTKAPQQAPAAGPSKIGYTTSGTYIENPEAAKAWSEIWERKFRKQRWVERGGHFYPRKP